MTQAELFEPRIHYARLENSERLQRLHTLLSDHQWHGTREIVMQAEVMAVVGRGRFEYRMP